MRPLLSSLLALLSLAALAACASPGGGTTTSAGWTPAQTAYVEIKTATAVIEIAAKTSATPGLSPAVVADIRAGAQALASGVTAQVAVLTAGGEIDDQAKAAAIAAVAELVSHLSPLLSAAHGSEAEPELALIAAGGGTLQTLPGVIGAVMTVQGGYDPPSDAIKSALSDLTSAAEAVGAA